ncbi:MAG: selenide, water dikinase SelD [Pseudomonadota bacterium]
MYNILRDIKCSGCAAKVNAKMLSDVLSEIDFYRSKNVLVGMENNEDAGIYKLTDNLAIAQTVDFFPPMVEDPFLFGQIAACNALSDSYAMGAKPITALNIMTYPLIAESHILKDVLRGGAHVLNKAEVSLLGGHTIQDVEIKYGMAITGLIENNKYFTNDNLKAGDILVLTKPLGTGIFVTALKAKLTNDKNKDNVIDWMTSLNKEASQLALKYPVKGMTDITGFSLAGHSLEMAKASNVSIRFFKEMLPYFEEVDKYSEMGLYPEASYKNKENYKEKVNISSEAKQFHEDILFDAQTSGGLLIALDKEIYTEFMTEYKEISGKDIWFIGEVCEKLNDYFIELL